LCLVSLQHPLQGARYDLELLAMSLIGEFCHEGVEEIFGGGAGGGELRFQLVHQGHQLICFGHDPALFGEGWEWDEYFFDLLFMRLAC
jgi:hypothetical protein